ncbi:MAG: hypothetical protein A2722_00430 [Candidatus Doudnabacteria bacterium RIFCSPHIGHO2_01_FULL_50_11]|uniref:N-acetyltransferase domain-containing protein n=1 Tax=Candidatus Doudnabacteria bacterium RIFCSPHIGHO2_01_FULL_50_11 TaxID=1817828 RepID=A0A1F5PGZ1_9BACT|nr:MAG: hypothetical protein A2722_00430 [Candidatus Doudnabacteria bacterium RIFCSPHIGHO2_01_FULL_50_11]HLC44871.1 GNAT family N-acetyltransferase [Patescibacteria group bacterium]
MSNIVIRKAHKQDFDTVVRLTCELQDYLRRFDRRYKSGRAFRPTARKNVRKNFSSRHSRILVVEHSGRVVGFCLGQVRKGFDVYLHDYIGFLYDAYLEPGFRKQGLMGQMLRQQFAWMQKRKVRYVELYVDPLNPVGMGAWVKYGFRPLMIRMRKDLKK